MSVTVSFLVSNSEMQILKKSYIFCVFSVFSIFYVFTVSFFVVSDFCLLLTGFICLSVHLRRLWIICPYASKSYVTNKDKFRIPNFRPWIRIF